MPKKKTIDTEVIKLKSIDQSVIERKDCLEVNLCFKDTKVFSPDEWKIIFNHFKCSVVEDNTIALQTRNSWKGLVMFFLSLAYMKYKDTIEDTLWKIAQGKHPRQLLITNVSFKYWHLIENNSGEGDTRSDPRIERIPAAINYPPCYVVGKYEPEDIKESLDNFCRHFRIDKEQSTVKTTYSKQVPHQYQMHSVENPYKQPEPFSPSTIDGLLKHIKDPNSNPFQEIDLTEIGKNPNKNN